MGPDWSQMTLGERLKYLREKKLRMSGYELVEELQTRGVPVKSHTTVYRYEKGRTPPADYVAAVADLAGVSVDAVMRGAGNGAVRFSAREAEDRDLVEAMRDLMRRRGWSQTGLAERSGIPQNTFSRWFALVEQGMPVRLTEENRAAIRSFLARTPAATEEDVALLARTMAADILEEIAAQLRTAGGTDVAPAVRRLLTGVTARSEDEAARLDRLAEEAADDALREHARPRLRAENG